MPSPPSPSSSPLDRPGGSAQGHVVGDFGWMDAAVTGRKSFWQRAREEPLVPVGCALTGLVLVGGLWSFQRGQSRLGNRFMQARVLAQGATVVALALGAYAASGERQAANARSYEERQNIQLRDE